MPLLKAKSKEPRELYKRGDLATHAWSIKPGHALIGFDEDDRYKVRGEALVIGAEEWLLNPNVGTELPRLFYAWVAPDVRIEKIPLAGLQENLARFSFGKATNRYLSLLIHWTNSKLAERQQELPPEYQRYQECSAVYAEMTQDLLLAVNRFQLPTLRALLGPVLRSESYRNGVAFIADRRIASIALPPTKMTNLAERFKSGTVICREGSHGESMYVLLEGQVAVVHQQRCLARITSPGEAFGEMALFLESERTASLIAETDCALYQISKHDLKQFHTKHPRLFFTLAVTLAARLKGNLDALERLEKIVAKIKQRSVKAADCKDLAETVQSELKALHTVLTKLNKSRKNPTVAEILERYASNCR